MHHQQLRLYHVAEIAMWSAENVVDMCYRKCKACCGNGTQSDENVACVAERSMHVEENVVRVVEDVVCIVGNLMRIVENVTFLHEI